MMFAIGFILGMMCNTAIIVFAGSIKWHDDINISDHGRKML